MPCHYYDRRFDEEPEEAELTLRSALGRWLWKTRIANHLSQEKLAQMAKTTPEIVAMLESDHDIITKIQYDSDYSYIRPVLVRIATALGLTPTSLLTFLE